MLSPLAVGLVVCVLVGVAIVVALTIRAGAQRADGTIARVLYEAENPDQRRR